MKALLLAACLLAPARAQNDDAPATGGSAVAVDTPETDLIQQASERLRSDPGLQAALAHRLMSSSMASQISGGEPPGDAAEEKVFHWVQQHPGDAASLAVGFSQDDANGTHEFEDSLHERVVRYLALNPDRYQGILGVLSAAGSQSKIIKKLEKKMDEEEQRELVKHLFEGKGGEQGRVLKQNDDGSGKKSGSSSTSPGVADSGVYDRLSELNPKGYSPNVLALQNALNAQRPAGAPKVPETGRLDYATLAAPAYALRADLDRQDKNLRAQRAWAIAQALGRGREFKPEQYADPAAQATLEAATKGARLPPRLAARREALDRARAAVEDFERLAGGMRGAASITKPGLRKLSAQQREAARWLLIADLEADLARVEAEAGFWTPELERLARNAPAPEPHRQAFLARTRAVQDRFARIRAFDDAAHQALDGADYSLRWDWIMRQLAQANALRPNLTRDVSVLTGVPPGLEGTRLRLPPWRVLLEGWVLRLAPWSAWGKQLQSRERRRAAWTDAFSRAAAGDFEAAQRAAMEAQRS